jgi:hypothetical protein
LVNTTGRAGHVAGLIGQHHWNTQGASMAEFFIAGTMLKLRRKTYFAARKQKRPIVIGALRSSQSKLLGQLV